MTLLFEIVRNLSSPRNLFAEFTDVKKTHFGSPSRRYGRTAVCDAVRVATSPFGGQQLHGKLDGSGCFVTNPSSGPPSLTKETYFFDIVLLKLSGFLHSSMLWWKRWKLNLISLGVLVQWAFFSREQKASFKRASCFGMRFSAALHFPLPNADTNSNISKYSG